MDSFTSEHELFLFTKAPEINAMIVGAFPKGSPEQLSRIILDRLTADIISHDIIEKKGLYDLHRPEKIKFAKEIPHIINTITGNNEQQQEYFNEVVRKCEGTSLGLVVDIANKDVRWRFASPPPMYNESRLKDLLLIHIATQNMVDKTGLGNYYRLITVRNESHTLVLFNNGINLSMIQNNLASIDKVILATSKLGFYNTIPEYISDPTSTELHGKYVIKSTSVKTISESDPSLIKGSAGIFLQTVLNSLARYFENLTNRRPKSYQISIIGSGNTILLDIEHLEDEGTYSLNVSVGSAQS